MIRAQLIHNPTAGEGRFSKQELLKLLKTHGIEARYRSSGKKKWSNIDDDTELIVVAGGDGTVRKVTARMLERHLLAPELPVLVLPLGTANNIAKTLYGTTDLEIILREGVRCGSSCMDIGAVTGLKESFFMEGMGAGVFPRLMKEMKRQEKRHAAHPEEELKTAQQLLYEITEAYKPRHCTLIIDGEDYSGSYMLVEIMNIRSIGPNIVLAHEADPGDGMFDIVLIPAGQKEKLLAALRRKMEGLDERFAFDVVRGREISLSWGGTHMHVDDTLLRTEKNQPINIRLKPRLFRLHQ